jgi:hypothetical protein
MSYVHRNGRVGGFARDFDPTSPSEAVLTKSRREIMEILEACDLTRCAWSAAQLACCDAKTVERYVAVP